MTDAEILDFAQAKYNMLLNHDKTFMFGEFQLQITSKTKGAVVCAGGTAAMEAKDKQKTCLDCPKRPTCKTICKEIEKLLPKLSLRRSKNKRWQQ